MVTRLETPSEGVWRRNQPETICRHQLACDAAQHAQNELDLLCLFVMLHAGVESGVLQLIFTPLPKFSDMIRLNDDILAILQVP